MPESSNPPKHAHKLSALVPTCLAALGQMVRHGFKGKPAAEKSGSKAAWKGRTGQAKPATSKNPNALPTGGSKAGRNELKELPHEPYRHASQLRKHPKCGFSLVESGTRHDFLYSSHSEARLFVIFSGDIDRKKIEPPAFHRWSWADNFPGHCLYVSDPSLHLDPSLGLAWYVGTSEHDPLPAICRIVREVAAELKISEQNLFAYGSSGGGFSALRLASIMPEICPIAINPQTDITKYHGTVDRFLRVCFGGLSRAEAAKIHPERLTVFPWIDRLRDRRMIYVQNTLDEHHFNHHYRPFITELGLAPDQSHFSETASVILFDHPGGHRKAETQEVFTQIMKMVTER